MELWLVGILGLCVVCIGLIPEFTHTELVRGPSEGKESLVQSGEMESLFTDKPIARTTSFSTIHYKQSEYSPLIRCIKALGSTLAYTA